MGLIAKDSGGGDFTPPPAGTHTARCVQLIDLGRQYSKFYDKTSPKVLLGFELPDEHTEKNEPFLIWKRYTMSLHENATLRADLQAWRGRAFTEDELEAFDLRNVLDKACLVNISHRKDGTKTYADVAAVMALPKKQAEQVPDRHHDLIVFDIDNPDMEVFKTFGDNLKKTLRSAEQAKEPGHPLNDGTGESRGGYEPIAAGSTITDDDIPF